MQFRSLPMRPALVALHILQMENQPLHPQYNPPNLLLLTKPLRTFQHLRTTHNLPQILLDSLLLRDFQITDSVYPQHR